MSISSIRRSTRSTLGLASSGTSPGRIHVLGIGSVGRAFLRRIAELHVAVVAASDSSGTLYERTGIDAAALILAKEQGHDLLDFDGAEDIPTGLALDLVDSDVVVDACASDLRAPHEATDRARRALRRGARVCFAAKDALLANAHVWRDEIAGGRIGWNAALGGTGRLLASELPHLGANCREITLIPNATTSCVIDAIVSGCDFDSALDRARRQGLCETDATLDLDGTDAAAKLAIVAGAVWGRPVSLDEIERDDLRRIDVKVLRERARRGNTTRLVACARRDGVSSVRFEELPRSSIFAAPSDRVVYAYRASSSELRVHVGYGLRADGTAQSLLDDVFATTGGVS